MSKFPEYYKSTPPDRDDLQPVYFEVKGSEAASITEGDDGATPISVYDVWMEDRNGFGLERVSRDETPFADLGQR